ncbi:hypothetical protein [Pedobacter sp. NJ-S-72]
MARYHRYDWPIFKRYAWPGITDIYTLHNASNFFKSGKLGYSPNKDKFEGLKLNTYKWEVQPLEVLNVKSSFFENEEVFPKGSVKFDNALLMTNIEPEWKSENLFH